MRVELAARRENLLGEGPLWDPSLGRLYWVDIRGKRIEWVEPAHGAEGRCDLDVRPSALALCDGGELLVAAERCIGLLDVRTGVFRPRVFFEEDKPGNRTNDGGVAGDGRFWFGTMDDGGEPAQGALYALSSDWRVSLLKQGISIPNGIVSSPDGRLIYVADSGEGVIWSYGIVEGALSAPSVFFRSAGASPDGAAMDAEGYLWSAQWDGACVLRLSPDGAVERKIDVPVSRPTACAFGDSDLRTLYITSARDGLSADQLMREPLAGSVFSARTHVAGLQRPLFAA